MSVNLEYSTYVWKIQINILLKRNWAQEVESSYSCMHVWGSPAWKHFPFSPKEEKIVEEWVPRDHCH